MKACELERLDNAYAATIDQLEECQSAKEKLANALEVEGQKVAELKKKYDEHCQLEKLETKLLTDQVKLGWALYQASNKEYEEARTKMNEFEERAAKKREELSQAEQLSQESSGGQDQLSARLAELTQKAEDLGREKLKLKDELKAARAPYNQMGQKVKQFEKREKEARQELKAAQKRLQEARDEIAARDRESEQARQAARLAKLEEDLAAARAKEEPLKQTVADTLKSYEELEGRLTMAKREAQDAEKQHRGARTKLEDLQRASGNSHAMFGQRVDAVVNLIQKSKRFLERPVGPIGAHIKIQPGKDDFAELAESALGTGTLDRFIVTSDKDRQILQDIRRQAGCRYDCGIFQVKKCARYAVPPPPVDSVETVASVLKIENDLVSILFVRGFVVVKRLMDYRALLLGIQLFGGQLSY